MSYTRLGYLAIKAEVTENTAVKPDVFVPLMSEDIVTAWGETSAKPVAGNRALNLRPLDTAIEAPAGTVNVLLEPKTIGYFLKAVFGAVTTGQIMMLSGSNGAFTVGETITGGTSAKTATVVAKSAELDYVLISAPSGAFTVGETLTGGSSAKTAVLVSHTSTVFGHQFTAPQSSLPTYTVEIGYQNEAIRFTGVRFHEFNGIAQTDNIITAAISMIARAEFKHARITAITTSGAGAKTLTLDQTTGLVAADTIKLFRPGTGYMDFSATSVKTHTVGTVPSETSITITNLETAVAVGDLIVLAPQTPSYTIDSEFTWIGGSVTKVASTMVLALAASAECIEDFELVLANEMEAKHCALGTNVVNRFPSKIFLKGLTGSGKLNKTYIDPTFLDRLRNGTGTSIQVKHVGNQIGSSGQFYTVDWRLPKAIFQAFNPSLSEDDLQMQEMSFDLYHDTTSGYFAKALLVTDVATY